MKKNIWFGAAGLAVLTPVLMALPGHSSATATSAQDQESGRTTVRRIEVQGPQTIAISTDVAP